MSTIKSKKGELKPSSDLKILKMKKLGNKPTFWSPDTVPYMWFIIFDIIETMTYGKEYKIVLNQRNLTSLTEEY